MYGYIGAPAFVVCAGFFGMVFAPKLFQGSLVASVYAALEREGADSASLIICARRDFLGAFCTCSAFRVSLGSDLSSVTSATRPATSLPNRCSTSPIEVGVSSTTSCSSAATIRLVSAGSLFSEIKCATSSRWLM